MVMNAVLAMFFANEVWAVYGIGIQGGDDSCAACGSAPMSEVIKRQDEEEETLLSFESALPITTTSTTHSPTNTSPPRSSSPIATNASSSIEQPLATETLPFIQPSAVQSAPSTSLGTPTSSSSSSPASPTSTSIPTYTPNNTLDTGVKIGIAVLAAFFGIALIAILLEACFLRRRRREKALQRAVQEVERGERALADLKASQEIVVLESRVSIIFDDGSEDEGESEVEEVNRDGEVERGRARNGMSLGRREY